MISVDLRHLEGTREKAPHCELPSPAKCVQVNGSDELSRANPDLKVDKFNSYFDHQKGEHEFCCMHTGEFGEILQISVGALLQQIENLSRLSRLLDLKQQQESYLASEVASRNLIRMLTFFFQHNKSSREPRSHAISRYCGRPSLSLTRSM